MSIVKQHIETAPRFPPTPPGGPPKRRVLMEDKELEGRDSVTNTGEEGEREGDSLSAPQLSEGNHNPTPTTATHLAETSVHASSGCAIVFVDPDDPNQPYWWPATVVPPSAYGEARRFVDPSFPRPQPDKGEVMVCYFEDGSFSIVEENDLQPFKSTIAPFITYARSQFGPEFRKDKAVQRAMAFAEHGKVPVSFKWLKATLATRGITGGQKGKRAAVAIDPISTSHLELLAPPVGGAGDGGSASTPSTAGVVVSTKPKAKKPRLTQNSLQLPLYDAPLSGASGRNSDSGEPHLSPNYPPSSSVKPSSSSSSSTSNPRRLAIESSQHHHHNHHHNHHASSSARQKPEGTSVSGRSARPRPAWEYKDYFRFHVAILDPYDDRYPGALIPPQDPFLPMHTAARRSRVGTVESRSSSPPMQNTETTPELHHQQQLSIPPRQEVEMSGSG